MKRWLVLFNFIGGLIVFGMGIVGHDTGMVAAGQVNLVWAYILNEEVKRSQADEA